MFKLIVLVVVLLLVRKHLISLFYALRRARDPEAIAAQKASEQRQAAILGALHTSRVPGMVIERLQGARDGKLPWVATLSPAELLIAQSHGIRPIGTVSATCWMHYGWSWTDGHQQGWESAQRRLRAEAKAAGANAVVDVKMRTVELEFENSMDFTLVGTAVKVDGLPSSSDPILATVPALEFVKLLEADVVPTGIAIGAYFEIMNDWGRQTNLTWAGNVESTSLSQFWKGVRDNAHWRLRDSARGLGNGVLAHVNLSQMFELGEDENNKQKRYLGRHIVVATVVATRQEKNIAKASGDGKALTDEQYRALSKEEHKRAGIVSQYHSPPIPHEFRMVVDMHAGKSPLVGRAAHHQSYLSNDEEGAI